MYGYHEQLTIEEIFLKVNQKEIFTHVFGKFQVGEYLVSPFRNDDSPGCWIQWHNGKLYFTDFGSYHANLDMIGIIQLKYNFSFKEALDFVANFKCDEEPEYIQQAITVSKSNSLCLEFCPKLFDDYHKTYWSQYEITSKQLIQDNIFATKWYKVNEHYFFPNAADTTYTISFVTDAKIKICNPKYSRKGKWVTNANQNVIGGTSQLPFLGETLYITKSYKDWRVLKNIGIESVIYFQNEGMLPDMNILSIYLNAFSDVIILFDNDEPGINASKKVQEYINGEFSNKASYLTLPTKEKDPADIIKAGNKLQLTNFLNLK
jgi:5S rRNA maturation endonuclease (ribonuclease M5)